MRKAYCITILILTIVSLSFASRNQRLDSLLVQLNFEQTDSLRMNLLIEISTFYNKDNRHLEQCKDVLGEALAIATKLSNINGLARIHHSYGILYRNTAKYDYALEHHGLSLSYSQMCNSPALMASAFNNIGVVYRRMDNHPMAAKNHLEALKIAEEIHDTFNIAVSLNSLGNIYSLNGQFAEATAYFTRALALAKSMDNKLGQAINYNNIGEVFEFMGVMDSAMVYYTKSLEANEKIGSQKGIAISYNAIGKILLHYGNVKEAYRLFNEALRIDKQLGDRKFISDSYINLGRALIALGFYDEALVSLNQGLETAKEIGSITHIQWAFESLSQIYKAKGQYDTALELFIESTMYKDSLLNEKNARSIAMMEVMFNTEKKESVIKMLQQAQELNQKELARQKALRNLYLAALIFTLGFAIAIYSALNIKRKANRVLAAQKAEIEKSNLKLNHQQNEILIQNQEIEKQRNSIEVKNKHLEEAYKVIEGYIGKMTDSIRYAQKIQNALLPPLSLTNGYFSDAFCLYKPKDFVSGDFYWLAQKDNKLFIAVADCTGHGVPGAFMSIIGLDLLNQALNQHNATQPAEILNFLNAELRNKLLKEKEQLILKDSMDIAVCSIEAEKNILEYSGAFIPMLIIRNKRIIEHKPNFTSIGTSTKLFSKPFDQQSIELEKGDWIYLYSDGYMDQFGGKDKKKFMRHRFYNRLIAISAGIGNTQFAELDKTFLEWKDNDEQIDDVLVVGLRF